MSIFGVRSDWWIFCSYICVWQSCLFTGYAQDAFGISFDIFPNNDITPGTPVNMTCRFQVINLDYRDVRYTAGGGPLLYRYTESPQENNFGGAVQGYGLELSENPSVWSVQWITVKTDICQESPKVGDYKCTVFDKSRSFSEATAPLKFIDPHRRLFLNGMEICASSNSFTWPWGMSLQNQTEVKFSTSWERSEIDRISVKISNSNFTNVTSSTSGCSYNASVMGMHTFTQGSQTVTYALHFKSGKNETKTCSILIPGSIVSGTEGTPKKLKGGGIAGIVIAVFVVVIGAILLGIMVYKKKYCKVIDA